MKKPHERIRAVAEGNSHGLQIRDIGFYTNYDPCNVCKREILVRAVIYPKAQFEVIRPVFKNKEGLMMPVQKDLDFSEFLEQNNLK